MPGFDKKGPDGVGPTGRGQGGCPLPRVAGRRGRGRRGAGQGAGVRGNARFAGNVVDQEIQQIKERIKELESECRE